MSGDGPGRGAVFVTSGGGAPADAAEGGGREEALRLRAADALERAWAFVDARADDFARLRARVVLEVAAPAELEAWLAEALDPQARLPVLAAPPRSSVARALGEGGAGPVAAGRIAALEALADHGRLQGPVGTRIVTALREEQREDGSFGDAPEPAARLALTGLLGGYLARSVHAPPPAVRAAGDFLAAHFTPERVEQEPWPELLGCAHYFTNAAHDFADEALQWCGRALEKGFRTGRIEAVTVTRVLRTCESDALPGASLGPDELLLALLAEQAGDGGFAALEAGGAAARVAPSVDALAAIVALARTLV